MFKKHTGRRSTNPVLILLRLILSLIMFTLLLGGVYSAYKHFSGLDPLKVDPQAVATNLLKAKTPKQFIDVLSSINFKGFNPNQLIKSNSSQAASQQKSVPNNQVLGQSGQTNFRFLLLSDSHNDNNSLRKAISQAKQTYSDIQFIIGMGDYTNVGTDEELVNAKKELDSSGLRYFLIAGDHDLWDSRDKQEDPATNFRQIFGPTYQSFVFSGFRFILLHNSDNYTGLDEGQFSWLEQELESAKQYSEEILVFLHEPLYHPSSDHVMGRVEPSLKRQAKNISVMLKEAGVKKVFFGDIHYFSEYSEPETNLPMATIGAVTIERNAQAPRFAVVSVLNGRSVKLEDLVIK